MAGTRSSTKGKQKVGVKSKEIERARGRNWQDDETILLIEQIQNNFDKFRGSTFIFISKYALLNLSLTKQEGRSLGHLKR